MKRVSSSVKPRLAFVVSCAWLSAFAVEAEEQAAYPQSQSEPLTVEAGNGEPLGTAERSPVEAEPGPVSVQRSAPVFVSLTFDDQRISQSVVRSALKANGRNFKATFYVISGTVNNLAGALPGAHPESLSLEQLLALEQDGHEIGGHTRTHADLPLLSAEAQTAEICGCREDLIAYGFGSNRPIASFAYPFGDFDAPLSDVVASCGFTSARTASAGPERLPPVNYYATKTTARGGSIKKTDSLVAVKQWITGAAPGQWVQLAWHDIESAEHPARDEYAQSLADFESLLDFLKNEQARGRVVVKTVGEVIAQAGQLKLP
jgi:peptidoglycan/xylan/chitin deacetylase (PgdA/CDA1 family)